MKPVSIKAIVDELEFQSPEVSSYLNTKTGAIEMLIGDDERRAMEVLEGGLAPEESDLPPEIITLVEAIHDGSDDIIQLPDSFDIHEYSLIEDFCFRIEDPEIKEIMLDVIRGTGAFRRFRDNAERFDLMEDWYAYRTSRLTELAKDWCDDNDIPWKP